MSARQTKYSQQPFNPPTPQQHPDKGGDAVKFAVIQRAYDVLSDSETRRRYDATGEVEKSVEDELLESFGGGAFRDRGVEDLTTKKSLEEALVTTKKDNESHSAGFEAWIRSRGTSMNQTIGVDDIIEQYGVVKGSYDEIQLPKIRAFRVDRSMGNQSDGNKTAGEKSTFSLSSEPIPATLEWGQVLLHVRASPVNPADVSQAKGAEAGSSLVTDIARKASLVGGNSGNYHPKTTASTTTMNLPSSGSDFIAVVLKIGAGVKGLAEGDWVMPRHPSLGAWRSLFCAREKDLRKIPADLMPLEHASMLREYCVAYRLLEDAGDLLRPGDAVIVDGASGAIGGVLTQLCALLKMRAVAVVRPTDLIRDTNANAESYIEMTESEKEKLLSGAATNDSTTRITVTTQFAKTYERLKKLGAAEVLLDDGDLRAALERRRFFARPKLALDCVGGASAARLAHSLQDGGRLVVFGCMSGRPITLPWTTLVARNLTAKGFSLRKWMDQSDEKKIQKMFEVVAKLVNAEKLKVDHCEYELSSEFAEAMEHNEEARKEVKVVLRVDEVGDTYE